MCTEACLLSGWLRPAAAKNAAGMHPWRENEHRGSMQSINAQCKPNTGQQHVHPPSHPPTRPHASHTHALPYPTPPRHPTLQNSLCTGYGALVTSRYTLLPSVLGSPATAGSQNMAPGRGRVPFGKGGQSSICKSLQLKLVGPPAAWTVPAPAVPGVHCWQLLEYYWSLKPRPPTCCRGEGVGGALLAEVFSHQPKHLIAPRLVPSQSKLLCGQKQGA